MAEEDINAYKALQADVQNLSNTRQQFVGQINENEMVMKELDAAEEGKEIFKLVGPALLTQNLDEVKENVLKRIEFIETEVSKVDVQVKAKQDSQKALGERIMADQQGMRARAADEARKVFAEQTGGGGGH
ncbi:Prefoldin [Pelagophyceae sp. CCMP2097]|nr:Prefoldin [Pelagophyceae sp. CCMP2097]